LWSEKRRLKSSAWGKKETESCAGSMRDKYPTAKGEMASVKKRKRRKGKHETGEEINQNFHRRKGGQTEGASRKSGKKDRCPRAEKRKKNLREGTPLLLLSRGTGGKDRKKILCTETKSQAEERGKTTKEKIETKKEISFQIPGTKA